MSFQTQKRMARETSKLPQLFLPQGDTNNNAELSKNQANNVRVQWKSDMDKLSNLKPDITKKWFRKQFGVRKDKAQLEGGERPQVLDVPAFRRERRRSSSLPDLSAMLDAANLRRHGSFISFSPGPARMADKEIVANLKGETQESLKEGNKANGSQKRDKDDGQQKTRGQELKGTAAQVIINTGLVPKTRRRSRSVPDLSDKLEEKSQTCQGSFTTSSPETANLARKKAILSEEAPWLFQSRKRCPTDPNLQTTMTTKKNKPPQLDLQKEELNNNVETSENKTSNTNVRPLKDMDKLANLKPPLSPLTKKWFRKQFGIRKDVVQLEGGEQPKTIANAAFQKSRRRSSSLPDLAAMLEAANQRKDNSLNLLTPKI